MRMRSESGQASGDFVALVGLVGVCLLAAGGIASAAAPGLRNGVTTAMQRALCTVTGQRCAALDREPCPLRRTTEQRGNRFSIGVIDVGDDRQLVIEQRSDGTYAMALIEDTVGGASVGIGARLGALQFGGSAGLALSAGAGRTYTAPDRASAMALVGKLRDQKLPNVRAVLAGAADLAGLHKSDPSVDEYVVSGKAALSALGSLGVGHLAGTGVEGAGTGRVSVKVSARTGEVTAYLQTDSRVSVFYDALSALSADLPTTAGKRRRTQRRRQAGRHDVIERDATAAGIIGTSGDVLEHVSGGAIALRFSSGGKLLGGEVVAHTGGGDRRQELRARLDGDDPVLREALLAAAKNPGDLGVLRALGVAAQGGAALDRRSFAWTQDESDRGLELALGLRLGAREFKARSVGRLIEQQSRPLGGVWEQRLDCRVV